MSSAPSPSIWQVCSLSARNWPAMHPSPCSISSGLVLTRFAGGSSDVALLGVSVICPASPNRESRGVGRSLPTNRDSSTHVGCSRCPTAVCLFSVRWLDDASKFVPFFIFVVGSYCALSKKVTMFANQYSVVIWFNVASSARRLLTRHPKVRSCLPRYIG